MRTRLGHLVHATLERHFPEQRLFLRSEHATRFIRLGAGTQILALSGIGLTVGWAIIATAFLLMDSIGSGSLREQAEREQALYEQRLSTLSEERARHAAEARAAQARFSLALAEISEMQSQLLASEDRRTELETGIEVIQTNLRHVIEERDTARDKADALATELADLSGSAQTKASRMADVAGTMDLLAEALAQTASERDEMMVGTTELRQEIAELSLDARVAAERNDRIFAQLEEAVSVSLEPLDKLFEAAGLPTDRILEQVKKSYNGQGGPLAHITMSTKGSLSPDELRANQILDRLEEMNVYRMAIEGVPFAEPVRGAHRFTSGYGQRRDPITGARKMHNGSDFASAYGTPIYATADGVVVHADWNSGYGRLVKIKHKFGIETRYAHLAKIRVKVGQKVSRGDRIGDMGNSGRSTGTHLHYEVRVGEKPVNPMTYIKAARDVF